MEGIANQDLLIILFCMRFLCIEGNANQEPLLMHLKLK